MRKQEAFGVRGRVLPAFSFLRWRSLTSGLALRLLLSGRHQEGWNGINFLRA